jgi:GH15 family glucan-1,4-alpha-glucosidase
MASLIEDYALIGDTGTTALVSRAGSIDWFCAPRFDSAACFASLLGDDEHGHWSMAPDERPHAISRSYRGDTLVLETVFTTSMGSVAVIDFMPPRGVAMDASTSGAGTGDGDRGRPGAAADRGPTIVRIVEGRSGTVAMTTELRMRFDYGAVVPWVRSLSEPCIAAVAGADGLVLHGDLHLDGAHLRHSASFTVAAGERVRFSASWFPSHARPPLRLDLDAALDVTERWWQAWSARATIEGPWRDAMIRSLITLKALTYGPTGGIVAAPTTSLPEWIGSVRNWDYRYCWLRDATFTLAALLDAGYDHEAVAWADWLRRAVAGSPDKMQIMYGVGGERRLDEYEVDWLPGYEGSAPVRIGNAASGQFQLDVYGEVMDMFLCADRSGLEHVDARGERSRGLHPDAIEIARFLVEHVRRVWRDPDDGIWEVRGPRRHFVHSKVMAWVAIDRWCQLIGRLGLPDEPAPWADLRDEIHAEVCAKGFDPALGSFTQYYGSGTLDASLLMIGLVGFLPPTDPRLVGTIDAVERELLVDGFVLRYRTDVPAPVGPADDPAGTTAPGRTGTGTGTGATRVADADPPGTTGAPVGVDGLPPGEGAFLLTTFWLLDAYLLVGRRADAEALFTKLLGLRNDVGLLAEEWGVDDSRMLGNFPQAFSHVGLLNAAFALTRDATSSAHRRIRPSP